MLILTELFGECLPYLSSSIRSIAAFGLQIREISITLFHSPFQEIWVIYSIQAICRITASLPSLGDAQLQLEWNLSLSIYRLIPSFHLASFNMLQLFSYLNCDYLTSQPKRCLMFYF